MATKTEQQVPAPQTPASSSCYFKKPEASTFFDNFKLRFDEFVSAPLDDHKACFKNTIQKVSEMPKAIKEKISLLKEDGSASSNKENQ
ncbi:hypothetical protein AgCh_001428 [Apium graveolens]